jgi:4-aminobutyrate aminotransferase-like enzyme
VAAELVEDRATKKPAHDLRETVVDRAYHNRLLLLGAGKSTIRFMPGLVVTADEVDEALTLFERSLAEALD